MSEPIIVDDPGGKLEAVIQKVSSTNEPVTLQKATGETVKVIPVPKPIRMWKGRPVYRVEDAKYLYLDYPWLLE